ncbi:MAG: hypothetical protein DWQ37_22580 [Planctomycetota bacterium]|nr:MAG: hypothetical protein DWQ37_22580 [Planctomycetota bacterium]
MGNKRPHHNNRRRKGRGGAPPPPPIVIPPSKPPIEYGDPVTLLEDRSKATFEFKSGTWVPFDMSIAECRRNDCEVKELPQKVKQMTRYEVRFPLE